MTLEQLIAERDRLYKHLIWLGIRSDGSERIEKRIEELDAQIIATKNVEYQNQL